VSGASERMEPTAPRLEPGAEFAGYRIERLLDRGGMGVVYLATEMDLDRSVALKIIAPEHTRDETAVARFKSEARLAASLEHPNIVPIHRGGEHDGVLFLAMRFVPGTNLRRIIDRGPMELTRIGRIIGQVAEALDVAHARGLIHRDVKPANILVSGEGDTEHVFLTDFGLTKRLGSAGDLTRTGGWVGTPDYVAPEQIQGHHVDRRADVYSLGCVLFEMLTGHVAYPKDSDMAKLWAHVTDPPPLPRTERPDLVEDFDRIVAKATAKDPDDRYSTAGELAAAVRAGVTHQQERRHHSAVQPTDEGEGAPFAPTMAEPAGAAAPERKSPVAPAAPVAAAPVAAAAATPGPTPPAETPPPPPAAPPPAQRDGRGGGGGGRPGRRIPLITGLVVAAAAAVAAVILLTGGSSSDNAKSQTTTPAQAKGDKVAADLGPVPNNRVDGVGNVDLRLDGQKATVTLDTTGLFNGVHALHIHAGALGKCPPGSAARRHNGHLAISTHNGVPFYGPPVAAMTTRGSTGVKSILALRRFPTQGNIKYKRTFRVSKVVAAYIRQDNAVVVVHGADYNHNGTYDNSLDKSELNRSLPGELTTPALCGPLVLSQQSSGTGNGTQTGRAPGGEVYHASLVQAPDEPQPSWLCPLHADAEGDRTVL
jgi:hypothetical protein